MPRTPLFILPENLAQRLSWRLLGLADKLGSLVPGLAYDVSQVTAYTMREYVARALLNAAFLAGILFAALAAAILARDAAAFVSIEALFASLLPAVVAGIATCGALLGFFFIYPRVLAGKLAEAIDKDLVFALKDLQLQISSGVTLFNALASVSRSGYGHVSREIELVVKDVNAGVALDAALERMARRTRSDFMRRTTWQLITALRGGAALEGALRTLIDVLKRDQAARIKSFVSELNMWSLIYMIFAVAIPGLGSTLLIVISTFGGVPVEESVYAMLLAACFVTQILLIGFIKSRRPVTVWR